MRYGVIFFVVAFPVAIHAQIVFPNGFKYPIFPGTHAVGMAYASTALVGDNSGFYWNPASLIDLSAHQLSLGSSGYQPPLANSPVIFPGILSLSFMTRRYGGWALGGYSVFYDSTYYAFSLGWGIRLNKFVKIGLGIGYRPMFQPKEKFQPYRLTTSAGILIQPMNILRFGWMILNPWKSIRFSPLHYSDSLYAWQQHRVGVMIQPFKFLTITGDLDLLRRTQHMGMIIKFLPVFRVRFGAFAPHLNSHLVKKEWKHIRFGAGFTIGNPGFSVSAIQLNEKDYLLSVELQFNIGKARYPVTTRPHLFTLSMPSAAGVHVIETPNPMIFLPSQMDYRIQHSDDVQKIPQHYSPVVEAVYPEQRDVDTEYQPPYPVPGEVVRIMFKQWGNYSLKEADEILQAFKQSIRRNPSFWPAYQQMGLLYLGLRRPETALQYLSVARQLTPMKAPLLVPLGVYAYLTNKSWYLHTLITQNKQRIPLPYLSGLEVLKNTLVQSERDSLPLTLSAGSSNPSSIGFDFYTALSFYNRAQYDSSTKYWKRIVQLHPQHPFGRLASLYLMNRKYFLPYYFAQTPDSIALVRAGTTQLFKPSAYEDNANQRVFSNLVGRVYVWLRLKNIPPGGIRVVPVWYWENKVVFVGKRGWRVGYSGYTYGYKTIQPFQVGDWRVDFFVKSTKEYLGSVFFTVKSEGKVL